MFVHSIQILGIYKYQLKSTTVLLKSSSNSVGRLTKIYEIIFGDFLQKEFLAKGFFFGGGGGAPVVISMYTLIHLGW